MGIVNKEEVLYMATQIDVTGLKEGKKEVLDILRSLLQESSTVDAFSGISMAAAAAFTQAAADVYIFSQEFNRAMDEVAGRIPEVAANLDAYRTQVLALTGELPVGVVDCARALGAVVESGKQGAGAMELLREAAARAVVTTETVVAALQQMATAGGGDAGVSPEQLQAVIAGTGAQVQLLQNRMMTLLRPLGDDLMQQVADTATRLGQAFSGEGIGSGLKELDTLTTVAATALRDYRDALDGSAAAVTAEAVALDVAAAAREAYRQVMEEERALHGEMLVQQEAYRSNLAETMAVEAESGTAKIAFAQQAIDMGQQLSGIVAAEVVRVREKKAAYAEDLQVQEALLESAGQQLAQSSAVREARQKEFDLLQAGNDQAVAAVANARLQQAVEKENVTMTGVDNARREVRNAQLRLEVANRQAVTASVVAGTVATGGSVAVEASATVSTTLLARAKMAATVATRSLTAALAANPLGMVLSVASLAITAFSAFGKETSKVASEQERLNEALGRQKNEMSGLAATLFDNNQEETARAEALLKLRRLMPEVWNKVTLANLAERDRNGLLKEGNEALREREVRELEAMRAASQRRIEGLKAQKSVSEPTIVGADADNIYRMRNNAAADNEKQLNKELANYREITEQLEYISQIDALKGGLGLSAEERLKRYKADLKELQEQLKQVDLQLQLESGGKAGQKSLNPAAASGTAKDLLEKQGSLQGKIADTTGNIKRLEPESTDNLSRREQVEQQLTDMVAQMYRRRERAKLDLEADGLDKQLKLIDSEYNERKAKIEQKEAELQGIYKKTAIPEKELKQIEELKKGNEQQRDEEKRQVEEKNSAEAKRHIEEQKQLFLSAEEQKISAITARYKEEQAWAKKNEGSFEKGDYEPYKNNLKENETAEKRAALLGNLQDVRKKIEEVQKNWEDKAKLVQDDPALYAEVQKAGEMEVQRLQADKIINTEEWGTLFSELDDLTVNEIDGLIATIETQMNGANLNPVDKKNLLKNLNEAKQQVITINPFHALGTSLQAVFKEGDSASGKSTDTIKSNWKNLGSATQGCFSFINDAMDGCGALADLIGESGRSTIGLIQGVATAGITMGVSLSEMEKGSVILTAISVALQLVNVLVSVFNKDKKKEAYIQGLQVQVEDLERAYDKLGAAIDRTYSDKAFDMMDDQEENLRQQQELIRQQIAAEQGKKKTDDGKIREWQNQLEDIDAQIAENQQKRIEMLAGTDVKSAIDEFADALVEAYARGEDSAAALGETTKKVMANAVKEALKRKFLGDQIKEAVDFLGNSMSDGALSDSEKATFSGMVSDAGKQFTEALKVYDDLFADDTAVAGGNGVTGQLQEAMTEGTASQLVGLWNMTANDIRSMRNLTAEQLNLCTMMNLNVVEVLRQQYFISANTRQTADNTALAVTELKGGFTRLDSRLKTIDENTKGYTGRGK